MSRRRRADRARRSRVRSTSATGIIVSNALVESRSLLYAYAHFVASVACGVRQLVAKRYGFRDSRRSVGRTSRKTRKPFFARPAEAREPFGVLSSDDTRGTSSDARIDHEIHSPRSITFSGRFPTVRDASPNRLRQIVESASRVDRQSCRNRNPSPRTKDVPTNPAAVAREKR